MQSYLVVFDEGLSKALEFEELWWKSRTRARLRSRETVSPLWDRFRGLIRGGLVG